MGLDILVFAGKRIGTITLNSINDSALHGLIKQIDILEIIRAEYSCVKIVIWAVPNGFLFRVMQDFCAHFFQQEPVVLIESCKIIYESNTIDISLQFY